MGWRNLMFRVAHKFDLVKLSGSWKGMDQTGQVRKESSNGRKL
ncbi:hypothetical protein HanRHA438_Chr03g0110491 [Helianthus annuus]|nr:hypothetical protein HanHA89_Chr09g0325181 [Helianthus annuus]KAJ0706232.1 hypothetical protein HanLR1_Chr09g0304691 [Helianthus annuus]KAJ0715067.1 hypothetical protein HanPI659440_Chr13g0496831 [Helianthus annuus]KAJ0934704.1 hypothetical protein HanRHA438_Chr03g0110491 [Helianthus annuus]